jgi:hypothetical protein
MSGFISANGGQVVDNFAGQIVPLAAGAPAALTASADTTFAFSQPVTHIYVQNKSAADVYVEFDAAATVGSAVVPANRGGLFFDIPCAAVHLFSTAATNVNGTADLNIVLRGWL